MTPSLLHAPPRPLRVSHTIWGGPPPALILFNLPPPKKATSRLSGDQNGYIASSVPVRGCAVKEVSRRTYNRILPLSARAVNASLIPSGESTGGPEDATMVMNPVPAGGRMYERTTGDGFGAWKT